MRKVVLSSGVQTYKAKLTSKVWFFGILTDRGSRFVASLELRMLDSKSENFDIHSITRFSATEFSPSEHEEAVAYIEEAAKTLTKEKGTWE